MSKKSSHINSSFFQSKNQIIIISLLFKIDKKRPLEGIKFFKKVVAEKREEICIIISLFKKERTIF